MRIAVSGLGAVSALGIGVGHQLRALREARSGVCAETVRFRANGGLPVGEVRYSDAELQEMLGVDSGRRFSRTVLLGMLAAAEALADAGGAGGRLRTGLVSGTSVGGMDRGEEFYAEFMHDDRRGRLRDMAVYDCGDGTVRIARYLGIPPGSSTTISTACSAASNAIMFGARLIRSGRLDRVVAGGADALCRYTFNGFRSLGILDSAPCRPFDASRAGLNLGEGAAYVVLQSEDTLERRPYAWLAGWANANDAFHQTASSETGEGALRAMRAAVEESGAELSQIDYIHTHGTGTVNNDLSEGRALLRLFKGRPLPRLGSTKPLTGHTLAASGGLGAVYTALALSEGCVWPQPGFSAPDAELNLTPETVLSEGVPLRRAMTNAFGFGGNCTTLIFAHG